MNEAETKPSTITITRIRFINANGAYPTSSIKAWCQTNEVDYCPLVISIMSFVILTSFLSIIYLCAKTSFKCPRVRCSILNKFRSANSQHRRRRRAHDSSFSLNSSTNYINDSVSLNSINHLSSVESVPGPNQSGIQGRSIWWITGGSQKRSNDPAPDLLIAPPSYDESIQQQRINRTKRPQIVRKQPKITATENAAFSLEACRTAPDPNPPTGTQFPNYRCLALTTAPTPTPRQILIDDNRWFQSIPASSMATHHDIDSLSMALDEVPPPYEAVIAPAPVASFNSSLSARFANYSFRSAREFHI